MKLSALGIAIFLMTGPVVVADELDDSYQGLQDAVAKKDAAQVKKLAVPLFELVYRDCIAMYGKYGYNPQRAAPYVLYHISLGRPLNYHSMPRHLYWKSQSPSPAAPIPAAGDPALFTRAEGGWAEGLHPVDRFIKNTCEVLCPLNEMTVRCTLRSGIRN